jgi:hypothetical protein
MYQWLTVNARSMDYFSILSSVVATVELGGGTADVVDYPELAALQTLDLTFEAFEALLQFLGNLSISLRIEMAGRVGHVLAHFRLSRK